MKSSNLILTAAAVAGLVGSATAQTTGPSTQFSPYVLPTGPNASNFTTTSILTAGYKFSGNSSSADTVAKTGGNGTYTMAGIPDGLGAYDNNDGTFTLLMNHELGNTVGVTRDHGAKGAFVSEWIIRKSDFQVQSGSDLIKRVYNWDKANQVSSSTTSTIAFNRFCSADLAPVSAFYNSVTGKGTQARIYLNGEEGGSTGYALATVATGSDKGSAYVLGKFNQSTSSANSSSTNVGGWENLLAAPNTGDKTIVIGNNDGGNGTMSNSLVVYVGTKTDSGTDVDKAGLTNGVAKFVNVTGNSAEIVNGTTRATNITDGTAFTLSSNASTTFSRPEDGAWDTVNANRYYFVTTDRLDTTELSGQTQIGRSRLWALDFTDVLNPDNGGLVRLLLDGAEGQNMFDNITVSADGLVTLLEDVGGADHNGKVWQYNPTTDSLTMVLKHSSLFGDISGGAAVAATSPYTNDEETSGVIDISSIMGVNGTTEKIFLTSDQAHYTNASYINSATVEGGQLIAIHQVTPVPEPSTYGIVIGLGAIALVVIRRRQALRA